MVVDLRSDTVTRPDEAMRAVIASAEVGDDVLGDDPTVRRLEERVATLLGKERALFFPSGIMANQAAILAQTSPGAEVVVDADAHVVHFEAAAAAAWAGVQWRTAGFEGGVPMAGAIAEAIRPTSRYLPKTGLVWLENTHNFAGGRVVPVEAVAAAAAVARDAAIPIHLDGARLPNAAVAHERPMRDWCEHVDSVMISLSKGLGAPVGSVLAGPGEMIEKTWEIRRRLGGGMRQSGLLAAAAIYGLENNFRSLADDHRRARRLAAGLAELSGLRISSPETNIVLVDLDGSIPGAADLSRELASQGILVSEFGVRRLRLVTHRDVDDTGIELALGSFREVLLAGPRTA